MSQDAQISNRSVLILGVMTLAILFGLIVFVVNKDKGLRDIADVDQPIIESVPEYVDVRNYLTPEEKARMNQAFADVLTPYETNDELRAQQELEDEEDQL